MYRFKIRLADVVIEIHSIYDQVYQMCKDYLCEESQANFQIISKQEDIKKEDAYDHEGKKVTDSYRETLSIYRKISEGIISYSCFLMHGSVLAVDDFAIMLCASSGVGKTTRSNLFVDQIQDAYIVNGDKPLIKVNQKEILACGTPWSGKEKQHTNVCVPLKAILLLERSSKSFLKPLSFSEAFIPLLKQCYLPKDDILSKRTLNLFSQLSRVNIYQYGSYLEDTNMEKIYQQLKHDTIN